jgi:hypothetical protein
MPRHAGFAGTRRRLLAGVAGLAGGCGVPVAARASLAWLAPFASGAAAATVPALTAPYTAEDRAHAARLRERALGDGLAWQLAESLCTEVGPRPAGSEADARAVAWALERLTRLGFSRVRADPIELRVWQRGPGQARLTAPHARELVMTALGNSPPTPEGGLEGELAYYPDFEALRAERGERARGRIVYIDQKMARTVDGSGYGPAVRARVMGPMEAARRGALALVIRSIGTDRDRVAHTGMMAVDPAQPVVPAAALSVPDAQLIERLHAAGAALRLHLAIGARQAVPARTHNVLAEVPGTDLAREIVLVGAHLDSWDVGQGALDNAAGVAIVVAAAHQILALGRRPRRTVRVVLFGNEENGFDGARHYAERYREEPHQLVGESDFGAGRVWRLRSRVAPEAFSAIEAMAPLLAPLQVALGDNQGSPGPDAAVLMRRNRWSAIELSQDGTDYFDVHHTDNDTLERIDPAALRQNAAAWSVVTWLAAQSAMGFG